MALIKNKLTQYGVAANYWKISRIAIDTIKKEVVFTLNLYASKENQAIELEDYTFASVLMTTEEFEPLYEKYFREDKGQTYKDIYTACYVYAKENIEFFADAEDDDEESMSTSEPIIEGGN